MSADPPWRNGPKPPARGPRIRARNIWRRCFWRRVRPVDHRENGFGGKASTVLPYPPIVSAEADGGRGALPPYGAIEGIAPTPQDIWTSEKPKGQVSLEIA